MSLRLRLPGDRSIEVDAGTVRIDGTPVPVGTTAARLLYYLSSNRGRVVPTEELLREVWGGAHVTISSVQQAVRRLRGALANGERRDALIRAVRGVGYQLGASVEVTDGEARGDDLPLTGRTLALARLLGAVESARSGRGQLVLLAGAPGIGKSRLLREVEARAVSRGFRFLCGRCPEQSGAAALWPWEEIVRAVLEDPGRPEGLVSGADLSALEALVPTPAVGMQQAQALDPGSARLRLYEAVRHLLVACARSRPLFVAIDDLHRADESSVRLLAWLAARNAAERIVLVAAYRDFSAQREAELRAVLGELRQLPGTVFERLSDLTREDVEALAGSVLPGRVSSEASEALWRRSAGNPFLLGVLLDPMRRAGAGSTSHALPPEAYAAVGRHVEEVSPRTRRVLRHAAVLGREIDPERLGQLADASPRRISAALAEARAAGLVEPAAGGAWRFVHALIAESLHDELDGTTKAALHARAAEILEALAQETRLGALAEHAFQGAARLGADRAAAHCERAAHAALRRYAFEEAARLHARALELSRDAEPRRRLALLLALGECHALGGQVAAATEILARAIDLARATGDAESQARAVLVLAVMRGDEIHVAEAAWIRSLEEAIEAYRVETPLRAQLLSRLAAAVWRLPPPERARDLARESVRLARRFDDADALISVLTRAYRILQTGPGDDADRAEVARDLALALAHARDALAASNGRITLLWQALLTGDPIAFEEQATGIVRQAEGLGAPQADWYALVARTSRAVLRGELALAEELSQRSLAVGEASGVRVARNHHLLQLFAIRWGQGRLAELEADFVEFAERPFSPWSWRVARDLVGLAAGRVAPARELLRRLCADPERIPRDVAYGDVVYMLAEIAAGLSEREAAATLVPRLEALCGRHYVAGGSYCHIGAYERPLGRVLGVLGRWDEAEAALGAGLASDGRLGAVAAVPRDQHDLGVLLLQRGRRADRPRARALLEAARASARVIGNASLERACGEWLQRRRER